MRPRFALPLVGAVLLFPSACGGDRESSGSAASAAASSASDPGVFEIVAVDRTFQAPDSAPAGWTTFRFSNASTMTHFAVVEHMPAGIGIEEQQKEAAPVFQDGLDLMLAGRAEEAAAKFGELPAWFGDIVFFGGPGLTAPGRTSQSTVYLEAGRYLLECYVKTDGVFHSFNPDSTAYGMVHDFTVVGPPSSVPEPSADLTLTVSSEQGIELSGDPVVGEQTVAVHFADQTVYPNFVGHDVHLVRLADDTDVGAVVGWMDWTRPGGLQTPAPATFVGGLNEMPAGETGYFTVTLEPGRYAWIAEVPDADENGLLREFSVPAGG